MVLQVSFLLRILKANHTLWYSKREVCDKYLLFVPHPPLATFHLGSKISAYTGIFDVGMLRLHPCPKLVDMWSSPSQSASLSWKCAALTHGHKGKKLVPWSSITLFLLIDFPCLARSAVSGFPGCSELPKSFHEFSWGLGARGPSFETNSLWGEQFATLHKYIRLQIFFFCKIAHYPGLLQNTHCCR